MQRQARPRAGLAFVAWARHRADLGPQQARRVAPAVCRQGGSPVDTHPSTPPPGDRASAAVACGVLDDAYTTNRLFGKRCNNHADGGRGAQSDDAGGSGFISRASGCADDGDSRRSSSSSASCAVTAQRRAASASWRGDSPTRRAVDRRRDHAAALARPSCRAVPAAPRLSDQGRRAWSILLLKAAFPRNEIFARVRLADVLQVKIGPQGMERLRALSQDRQPARRLRRCAIAT